MNYQLDLFVDASQNGKPKPSQTVLPPIVTQTIETSPKPKSTTIVAPHGTARIDTSDAKTPERITKKQRILSSNYIQQQKLQATPSVDDDPDDDDEYSPVNSQDEEQFDSPRTAIHVEIPQSEDKEKEELPTPSPFANYNLSKPAQKLQSNPEQKVDPQTAAQTRSPAPKQQQQSSSFKATRPVGPSMLASTASQNQ